MVQGLLKKHEAFEVDLGVHEGRSRDILEHGRKLVADGNHHAPVIEQRCKQLEDRLRQLSQLADARLNRLRDNSAYLQFIWKCDVVESWIGQLYHNTLQLFAFTIIGYFFTHLLPKSTATSRSY